MAPVSVSARLRRWVAVLALCCLAGCRMTPQPSPTPEAALPSPEQALPDADVVPGWSRADGATTYDRDTLFDFMNGAADLYFTFGFELLAVGKYVHADGGQLRIEVYRTATDADAYGLFTYNAYGEPIELGVDGRLASRDGLSFWQRRTFVQILGRGEADDGALRAFAKAVASALPADGKRPALVDALPADGLQPGSARFFREPMALDNFLWLGPENVLGLGPDAEGVLAEYQLSGQEAILMLVAFADSVRAQAAQSGLEGAGVEDLVAVQVHGNTVGAVFGQPDHETASALLDRAFATVR